MACPVKLAFSFSFAAGFGASSVTWTFGRLYSSTAKEALPTARPSTCSDIPPIKRSRGAVQLPVKEPKLFGRLHGKEAILVGGQGRFGDAITLIVQVPN